MALNHFSSSILIILKKHKKIPYTFITLEILFVCSPVSFLLLLPGMNQYGIISKYSSMAKREINKLLKQKEKKNE